MNDFFKFQAYVEELFGYRVEYNTLWLPLVEKLCLETGEKQTNVNYFFHMLIRVYCRLSYSEAFNSVTDPFFFNVILALERSASLNVLWQTSGGELLDLWTQGGTRDISDEHAKTLTPLLQQIQLCDRRSAANIINIARLSPKLWIGLSEKIYLIFKDEQGSFGRLRYYALFFKYASDIEYVEKEEQLEYYERLCDGFCNVRPTLHGMYNILKGVHNNALAWHTALAVCDLKDPTVVGSWIKMFPAFSSLALDPKDQASWHFWHLLHECTKQDASGQELMLALSKEHPLMHQAFSSTWTLIDTIYEKEERYERASKIFDSTQCSEVVPLVLPVFS